MSDSLLRQGIAAAKAGDKRVARRLLSEATRQNPDSEKAWLWLSGVLDTPQGRAHCLRRVLAINPDNRAAKRGLAALEAAAPAPAVVTRPAESPGSAQTVAAELRRAVAPSPAVVEPRRRPQPWQRQQFWRLVVAGLAVVALSLVGLLAYAALDGARADSDGAQAALILPSPTAIGPQGTLRPTFTTTPTDTPTPSPSNTPTPTRSPTAPSPTPSPTPTETPTPTSTSTPRPRRRRPAPTSPPAPTPTNTPHPRTLDPRLAPMGVRVEPAFVGPGKPYWRLIRARWTDEQESAGKHSIYVEVLDANGNRALGRQVVFQWVGGNLVLPVEDRPPPDWPVNFAMYNTLGSYAVSVSGAPSDRIVGLGLGTAEAPAFTIHTCFYLTFRLVYR